MTLVHQTMQLLRNYWYQIGALKIWYWSVRIYRSPGFREWSWICMFCVQFICVVECPGGFGLGCGKLFVVMWLYSVCVCACVCVCVCVCVLCARACVCMCVCVCSRARVCLRMDAECPCMASPILCRQGYYAAIRCSYQICCIILIRVKKVTVCVQV
jgi:hypothetical protein